VQAFSSPAFLCRFFSIFECYRCGSLDGFVSRPRNLFERYGLRFLAMRPARCGHCYRRSYRPMRVPLLPRREDPKVESAAIIVPGLAVRPQAAQEGTDKHSEDRRRIA
jgi:hypothetical protein